MRKTRNLFKKVGDTKGTFNAKIGTIKDNNNWYRVLCWALVGMCAKSLQSCPTLYDPMDWWVRERQIIIFHGPYSQGAFCFVMGRSCCCC